MSFRDGGAGAVSGRVWDFGDGASSRASAPGHSWSEPGFYRVRLVATGAAGDRDEDWRDFLVRPASPDGSCEPGPETLCLRHERFRVEVEWWTLAGDERRPARVAHAGANDTGMFWFVGRDNWEILVKVLDGDEINGCQWVFGASTTNLGYRMIVTDTRDGAKREYLNDPGSAAAAITETRAFPDGCGSSG